MLQTCTDVPVTWRSVCNNKKTMSSDNFATLYNTLSHIDTLNSYGYPTFIILPLSHRIDIKLRHYFLGLKTNLHLSVRTEKIPSQEATPHTSDVTPEGPL
jgi:hypothetical protein